MAGGKGKSSGGKSSGGKVGADAGKKQQSHSSKAGLQVSDAQSYVHYFSGHPHQSASFAGLERYIPAKSQHPAKVASASNRSK
jgi:hypothetical protein